MKNDKEKSSIGKNIVKGVAIVGGIGLTIGVINEVRKEYNKTVDEYNELVDKYNNLTEFIDDHDFYKKPELLPNKEDLNSNGFVETIIDIENEEDSEELVQVAEYDPNTELTLISIKPKAEIEKKKEQKELLSKMSSAKKEEVRWNFCKPKANESNVIHISMEELERKA